MKQFLTLLLVLFIIPLSAQTYFYVNAIEVIPEEPTSADEVFIHVFGDFSSSGSYITGHSVYAGQDNILLSINCASTGGLTVLVPHDTILAVGTTLFPGDYTINLNGTGLGDFVSDPEDFLFTVASANGLEEQLKEQITWTYSFGRLSIYNGTSHPLSLTIVDLEGRQIHAEQNASPGQIEIDLKQAQGYYLLELDVEKFRWREKFFAD